MKTVNIICLLTAVTLHAAPVPDATVAERGPHHAVWQRVMEHTTPYGRTYYVTNSYQELATGKHYLVLRTF